MHKRILYAVVAALPFLHACGGGDADGSAEEGAGDGPTVAQSVERELRDLITAVSPLAPGEGTALTELDWHERRDATLKRLRQGTEALGLRALDEYRARPSALREVRGGLLDIAGHCAPAETRPVLIELVQNFGEDMGLRKKAVEVLGRTSPTEAVSVLEPILVETQHSATYPPQDAILKAWLEAMGSLGSDPVVVLSDVATNIRQEHITRNLAIKALGDYPSPRGRQALELVLVESGGNHMTRRFAAQSLRASLEGNELCTLIERVFENEADVGFQGFLSSMIDEECR